MGDVSCMVSGGVGSVVVVAGEVFERLERNCHGDVR